MPAGKSVRGGRAPRPVFVAVALVASLAVACDDTPTGTGGGGAATTSTTSSTSTGTSVKEVLGCDGAKLLENPADTSARGPWTVGARTVKLGALTAEVWYPAIPPTSATTPKTYDLRQWLPDSEKPKITDDKAPLQTCDCVDALPIDDAHGPYPVVVFVHGTAGFRTQSLEIETHWASRGFIVVAADHPGLYLQNLIESICGQGNTPQDLAGDLATVVAAVKSPTGDLAFLEGHVDSVRLAMSGHSAGGGAVETQGDVAKVLIPMAAGGTVAGSALESTLVLGSKEDQVVSFSKTLDGYLASPKPRRLVEISPGGHLVYSSLCQIQNAAGQDIVTIGKEANVCGLNLAGALFDCAPEYVSGERGWAIVDDATSAVLEQTLHCQDRTAALSTLKSRYPEITDYRDEP
ncbi:MAG: hypothetical protein U0414_28660 [Polyangiaceae bacterium]